MENDKSFASVWKALFIVGSIAAAVFAVDARYVADTVFQEFKDGTIAAIDQRLNRIEAKLDALLNEKRK